MSCDVGDATESLENEQSWFSKLYSRFTYVTTHYPTLPSLHLRHNSFSNPSLALPMSQLILQSFRCFTYVIVHSPTLLSLLLPHRIFTYVAWRAAHLCHSSFSNPSVALPTSQLILQPFRCFAYVTVHSPALLSLLLRHKLFTLFTWRTAHDVYR